MMHFTIENEAITAEIAPIGAELQSLTSKITGTQYLWNGDEAFWIRRSPVLFPVVGRLNNNTYRHNGLSYPMSQHGFARDLPFSLTSQTQDSIWMSIKDNEETRKIYPFQFQLEIGYELAGSSLKVTWRVTNTNQDPMYFSIGAHPGFCCPLHEYESQNGYGILLMDEYGRPLEQFTRHVLGANGLVIDKEEVCPLKCGVMTIDEHLFDIDTFIVENHQAQKVSLLTPAGRPYVTVSFDAPLFGIWSPPGKQAPFVCIEPWYGRCDREGFSGELKERAWGNILKCGEMFERSYTIKIL